MRRHARRILTVMLLVSFQQFPILANAQETHVQTPAAGLKRKNPEPRPCLVAGRPAYPKPEALAPVDEEVIKSRTQEHRGITVDVPKIYDDAMLQQMLRTAEARLGTLQLIDQASLLAKLGAVSGASQQSSGLALNVQGAPVPQMVTGTKLPTETTTATESTTAAGATSTGLTTVSGLGTQDVTTTRAGFGPPAATAPAPTVTFPSGFSVASSDILSEQMQLTAEVNGLRLLLAGSLSDYFINNKRAADEQELVKLKTTLGFSVALAPDKRYKDAAAIVEVEVRTCQPAADELPAVTAILPREKTYNVAAIRDSTTSVGGGVATQIIGFSGSWVRGHKTHYLVQDQDTVASTFRPTDPIKTGFAWQFRPVLGQRYVKAGLKQTFVQLAFPTLVDAGAGEIGQVTVRTYWRKYDRKTGLLKDIVRGSFQEAYHDVDIRSFKEPVMPIRFNEVASIEDLGGGQALVKLEGKYLPGTYVRIGSTPLTDLPRFKHEHLSIKFTSTFSELATKGASLVARDGREVSLIAACSNDAQLGISDAKALPFDDSTSRLRVRVAPNAMGQENSRPKLFFVIGQRVFGDSDSPLKFETENGSTFVSALVPNAVYTPTAKLLVKTLMGPGSCVSNSVDIGHLKPPSSERLVVVEQGTIETKYLLSGQNLRALTVLSPGRSRWEDFGYDLSDRMRILVLKNLSLKTNKQVLFQRGNEKPFLLTIPEFEPRKPAAPKALGSIVVGADEVIIVGEGLSETEGIMFREQAVTSFKVINDQALRLNGLVALGLTTSAGPQRVFLKFKSAAKPTEVDIQVVNSVVRTMP